MNHLDTARTPGVGRGTAHAKFILVGEHAVVHGRPAIAAPFPELPMIAEVSAETGPLRLDSEHYTGALAAAPERLDAVRAVVQASLLALGLPEEGLVVRTTSSVPIERGLGSSAAVSGAIVRALFDLAGRRPSAQELFDLVQVSERIAHGTPSGLDALATTASGPIWFENGVARPLSMGLDGHIIVADTGVHGHTRGAVADVRALKERQPARVDGILDELAGITHRAAEQLVAGDGAGLGAGLDAAHELLRELTVSSIELERLVGAARAAGALGAKLTGGGRGGCMIAYTADDETAERVIRALRTAGARDTWRYDIRGGRL